jgi:hypothetical protein
MEGGLLVTTVVLPRHIEPVLWTNYNSFANTEPGSTAFLTPLIRIWVEFFRILDTGSGTLFGEIILRILVLLSFMKMDCYRTWFAPETISSKKKVGLILYHSFYSGSVIRDLDLAFGMKHFADLDLGSGINITDPQRMIYKKGDVKG